MKTKSPGHFPKRKWPRLAGFDYSSPSPYAVTICSEDRRPVFCDPGLNREVIGCLKQEAERTGFTLLAYCLMPDHLHILAVPRSGDVALSGFIGGFKSKSTRRAWQHGIEGRLWQES